MASFEVLAKGLGGGQINFNNGDQNNDGGPWKSEQQWLNFPAAASFGGGTTDGILAGVENGSWSLGMRFFDCQCGGCCVNVWVGNISGVNVIVPP